MTGRLSVHPRGFGFIVPANTGPGLVATKMMREIGKYPPGKQASAVIPILVSLPAGAHTRAPGRTEYRSRTAAALRAW